MKKGWISPLYVLNIVVQAIFDFCTPIALGLLGAWLLSEKAGVGGWIYALLATLGVLIGFFSMCKFILRSMSALERLEKQNAEKETGQKEETKGDSRER